MVTPLSFRYLMLVSPFRNQSSSSTIAFNGKRLVVSIGNPAPRLKRIWCPKMDKVPVPVRSCFSTPSDRIRSSRSWYWFMASGASKRRRMYRPNAAFDSATRTDHGDYTWKSDDPAPNDKGGTG